MKMESFGIILALRPFGERDVVAHIFTRDFGMLTGMIKGGGAAKKNKPLIGQCGNVSHGARLDSMLGAFHFESSKNMSAQIMMNSRALKYMNSAFALMVALLPERVKFDALYDRTIALLNDLADIINKEPPLGALSRHSPPRGVRITPHINMEQSYLNWEIYFLSELGYALDVSKCSGCGTRENLTHISPKTARAVCATCAAPYAPRLLKLPIDLTVTKFFLAHACRDMGISQLPLARNLI